MKRAVFLDRDGVTIEAIVREGKPYSPATLSAVKITEDIDIVLQKISAAGFMIIGITNQPDVARGLQTKEAVEEINHYLVDILPIKTIMLCCHDEKDECNCRKPKPGLLLDAAKLFNIDLAESYMVGDRWKDVDAGKAAGCKTIFIDYGYLERQPENQDFTIQKPRDILGIIIKTPNSG
ncbi:MAG: HAD-IIIA family hydrolase [Geobacteraceae bacterium]|nr:HAD-IIIA family hydrolase [Geobacteraceae bacterium]